MAKVNLQSESHVKTLSIASGLAANSGLEDEPMVTKLKFSTNATCQVTLMIFVSNRMDLRIKLTEKQGSTI